jgi:peptidase E
MNTTQPVYLLAGNPGNRRSPDPSIQLILKATGKERPSIAYIGAASGDDKSFFHFISDSFIRAGAGQVTLALLVSPRVDIQKARDILQMSDIVFISGGDVEAGMQVLQEKDIVNFLTGLFRNGKPFFGVSAGSIMLAREWVRWRDPDDDSTAELFPCLGFAPVICDTHAEADDWEELIAALNLEKDSTAGYGIPTGAGLKVYPEGKVEALGKPVAQYLKKQGQILKQKELWPVS